jgi:hypothetical protein
MRRKIIKNIKTGESIISFSFDNVENVNPIKYFADIFKLKYILLADSINIIDCHEIEMSRLKKLLFFEAEKMWKIRFEYLKKLLIPEGLIGLLSTTKKSEQEKIIKTTQLSPEILENLIYLAYEKFDYRFSQYRFEIPEKGTDPLKIPYAIYVNKNGQIESIGKTEYSNNQLKQALEQRKVTVGIFLERKDFWHCFFGNYNGLFGHELWKGKKQSHFHYISSSFGLSKEHVINELKSGNYKLKSFHIKFIDDTNS